MTNVADSPKKILLAQPRGFCAGVDRAIEIVEKALEKYGPPVYVRHEIVHNRHVVESLRKRGAVFVEEISEIPENAPVIFSAHGVSKKVVSEANERGLESIDATCPLVTKVHIEARKLQDQSHHIILIGHEGHPEVEGTMGQIHGPVHLVESVEDVENLELPPGTPVAYITQTTLSLDDTAHIVDALKKKFPDIRGPKKDDICYATQNRQNIVKTMAPLCDVLIVLGAPNSSNSNRLREVAERCGTESYLVEDVSQIEPFMIDGKSVIGITAGASAPEILVREVIDYLNSLGWVEVERMGDVQEKIEFLLPRSLA